MVLAGPRELVKGAGEVGSARANERREAGGRAGLGVGRGPGGRVRRRGVMGRLGFYWPPGPRGKRMKGGGGWAGG